MPISAGRCSCLAADAARIRSTCCCSCCLLGSSACAPPSCASDDGGCCPSAAAAAEGDSALSCCCCCCPACDCASCCCCVGCCGCGGSTSTYRCLFGTCPAASAMKSGSCIVKNGLKSAANGRGAMRLASAATAALVSPGVRPTTIRGWAVTTNCQRVHRSRRRGANTRAGSTWWMMGGLMSASTT
jgi:hypothetical protein